MRVELINQYYDSEEYLVKLRARAEVLEKAADPLERAQIIANVWAVDPVRFIEDVLVLKIPEYGGAVKPFFLFPYQTEIIWRLVQAEQSMEDLDFLIDKLRGMGMTWLIAAYMYWRWSFTPRWSGFVLSRTESEVDDGTDSPDNSIFGKIRFFIKYTPKWLLPETFTAKGKKGTSTDSTLRLINPTMESSINGSSTNANAGRSRRYSFTFVDECFFIENFRSVWRSLQSVSRIKVFVSSVKQGKVASDFKELCTINGTYITLDYTKHPWKDKLWYEEKEKLAEFDSEVMKEISVDYSVNMKDQYYPEIRQSQTVPLVYRPELPLYAFLDFGKQDLTIAGFAQFNGSYLDILTCYANKQKPNVNWYIPFLNPLIRPDVKDTGEGELLIGRELFRYTPEQVEWMKQNIWMMKKPVIYFGEAAHFITALPLNTSIAKELFRNGGIRIICNNKAIKHEPRRHATSLLLPKMRFNTESDGAMDMYDAIATSRYNTSATSAASKDTTLKPKHDEEIADYRAALENLCVNIPRILRHQNADVGDNFRSQGFAASIMKYLKV